MPETVLRIDLLSDTTFSRGDGTAGEVDVEIAHDTCGLPILPARTIRGLLREAWLTMADAFPDDHVFAAEVLGVGGNLGDTPSGRMRIGDGVLPAAVRAWVTHAVSRTTEPVEQREILQALTDIRAQTARSRATGGPETGTLRSSRVALRGLFFESPIDARDFTSDHWRVLARCCLGVRHAGLGRSRGRGHVRVRVMQPSDKTKDLAALEPLC